jgi:hypothetical protein
LSRLARPRSSAWPTSAVGYDPGHEQEPSGARLARHGTAHAVDVPVRRQHGAGPVVQAPSLVPAYVRAWRSFTTTRWRCQSREPSWPHPEPAPTRGIQTATSARKSDRSRPRALCSGRPPGPRLRGIINYLVYYSWVYGPPFTRTMEARRASQLVSLRCCQS